MGVGTANYLKNVSLKLSSGIVSFVMNYAVGIITARALGAEGYGMVTVLVLIPTMIAMFGNLGVDKANGYLAGAHKHTVQTLLNNSALLTITISLLVGIAYWAFMPLTIKLVSTGSASKPLLGLVFVAVPFGLLEMYLQGILWGQERIAQLSLVSIVRFFSLLVLNVMLVLVFGLGVLGAVLAAIATPGICAALYLILLRKDVRVEFGWGRNALKDALVFGIQAHLGNVLSFLGSRLDVFIINLFVGVTEVGYYAVAVSLAEMLLHVPMAFAFVLFPKTAASDPETAKRFTPKVARLTGFATLAIAVGLFLASKFLITVLYGEEFAPALYPLWILLPGMVCVGYSQVIFSDLGGRGKPYYGTLAASFALLVTIGIDLLLIPRWGILGAAIASSLSSLTNATVAIIVYMRLTENKLIDVLLIQRRDITTSLQTGREMVLAISQSLRG